MAKVQWLCVFDYSKNMKQAYQELCADCVGISKTAFKLRIAITDV